MRTCGSCFAALLLFAASSPALAQVEPGQVRARKANQCLSDQELKTNKDLKALTRPTTKSDPNWMFDPHCLLGTWSFDWDTPETPISSGGKTTGTYTFKRIEDCFFEGILEANSP